MSLEQLDDLSRFGRDKFPQRVQDAIRYPVVLNEAVTEVTKVFHVGATYCLQSAEGVRNDTLWRC